VSEIFQHVVASAHRHEDIDPRLCFFQYTVDFQARISCSYCLGRFLPFSLKRVLVVSPWLRNEPMVVVGTRVIQRALCLAFSLQNKRNPLKLHSSVIVAHLLANTYHLFNREFLPANAELISLMLGTAYDPYKAVSILYSSQLHSKSHPIFYPSGHCCCNIESRHM